MKILKAFKNKEVQASLNKYFNMHHDIYSQKVSSTQWEELSYKAFRDNLYTPSWDSGSHKKGVDIFLDGEGLSYKTGVCYHRKRDDFKYYEFSGSRLTSYETLTEKVDALKNANEDVFVFLGCEIINNSYIYTIRLLDKKKIPYENIQWDMSNLNSLKGIDPNSKFCCIIHKKMSSQIWYKIPYEWLTVAYTFTVDKND